MTPRKAKSSPAATRNGKRYPNGMPAGQRKGIAQMTPPTTHDETATVAQARARARGRVAAFLLSGIGIIMGLAVAGAIGYFAGLQQNVANERNIAREQQLAQHPALAETVRPEPVRSEPVPTEPVTAEQRPPAENFIGLTLDGEPFALGRVVILPWPRWTELVSGKSPGTPPQSSHNALPHHATL